jgi:hypothetical protein
LRRRHQDAPALPVRPSALTGRAEADQRKTILRSRSVADQSAPDEQKLIEELQAELAKLKVSDLLLQTLYSVSSLGYHRLSPESRDLDQARLAIEALRALVPVLEGSVAEDALRDFNQVLANLQLAYASAAAEDPQS